MPTVYKTVSSDASNLKDSSIRGQIHASAGLAAASLVHQTTHDWIHGEVSSINGM
ncbi:hypothetical protein M413DRAFT_442175 [Hebeloma cylindrosporum]|uniref:Uncharacterized protein n=1 Tax=Hebeloma cylindrosporum TaxID=76867 RepID=A0A0C2Y6N1_HEBCY|nr:hypothetical protein M413DRAFT_442175 [Hebeloma cylindrosporum h7]